MTLPVQDVGGIIRLPKSDPNDPTSPTKPAEAGRDYEIQVPANASVNWDTTNSFGSETADQNGKARIPVPPGSGGQTLVVWLIVNGKSVLVEVLIRPETG